MLRILENYSLLPHNSFGLDVKAHTFVEYDSVESLQEYIKSGSTKPLLHIGGGNNLLFTRDFAGTILHSAIKGKQLIADTGVGGDKDRVGGVSSVMLRVGAAEVWDDLVAWTLANGYYGLENFSLIPSEVGAAAVQNIGAYGAEAKNFIRTVDTVDLTSGEAVVFSNKECQFAYRYSNFKGPWAGRYAITHVTFCLSTVFTPNLTYRALQQATSSVSDAHQLRQAVVDMRRSKLPEPSKLGNAGSFFMNPIMTLEQFSALQHAYPYIPHFPAGDGFVKVPAAWLTEQCGWKGRDLGRAGVYERQPLVLVNRGGANGVDVLRLAEAVISDVKAKFGIELHPEVMII